MERFNAAAALLALLFVPQKPPPLSNASDLPLLFRDAIVVLNVELARQHASLSPRDVMIVRDGAVLKQRLPDATPAQIRAMTDQFRMLVIENRPPIYVITTHADMVSAIKYYQEGRSPHLRYLFAAMLGHEWLHAFREERTEAKAYAFELQLLFGFWDDGSLPVECAVDIESTQKFLLEAWKVELENRRRHQ